MQLRALPTVVLLFSTLCPILAANGAVVHWTDWQTGSNTNGFTGVGTITTTTTTLTVTYNNPQGIAFFQNGVTGDLTDYFAQGPGGSLGRVEATSPYTSGVVDNIPFETEMIALNLAGIQTLSFSQTIANPFFSYVSLNGNGYAFDQDFEILSVGGVDGNDSGYWGSGTSFKQVVDLGGGNFEYQLLGTGEPHGTIRFLGTFDTVSWRSLSNEYWNGFTVGVQGTKDEVFPTVPEPSTLAVWSLLGLAGLGVRMRHVFTFTSFLI